MEITLEGICGGVAACVYFESKDKDVYCLRSDEYSTREIGVVYWRSANIKITGGPAFLKLLLSCEKDELKIKSFCFNIIKNEMKMEDYLKEMHSNYCKGVEAGRSEIQESIKNTLGIREYSGFSNP